MSTPTEPFVRPPLFDEILAGLRERDVAHFASEDTPQVVLTTDDGGTVLITVVAPGMVSAFAPLIEDVGDEAEVSEAVALLNLSRPIPAEWLALAAYRPGDEGEVGLVLALPMPGPVDFILLGAAITFIAETRDALVA